MTYRKTQILTWLVVLLLVLNAVTIGTILYHNYQEKKAEAPLLLPGPGGGNPLNGRFLRQELGFDRGQMDIFRELNHDFRPRTMDLTYQIDSLKEEMFAKMQESVPDSLAILQLAAGIGNLHGDLKKETFLFYNRLRQICRSEQKARLEEVFRPLFINDQTGPATGPPYHRGPGWRNQPGN